MAENIHIIYFATLCVYLHFKVAKPEHGHRVCLNTARDTLQGGQNGSAIFDKCNKAMAWRGRTMPPDSHSQRLSLVQPHSSCCPEYCHKLFILFLLSYVK
jgi:hypothetical protein